MPISRQSTERLLDLVRKQYPNWKGFSDERFVDDEIEYKRTASKKALELLSAEELRRLIVEENYDEVTGRIREVAQATNLLFMSVPRQGDLSVLHSDGLNKAAFCEAFLDLLWGSGDGPERLNRYIGFVNDEGLPSKWSFPTYFLFLAHPGSESIVKPEAMHWFCKAVEHEGIWSSEPSSSTYSALLALLRELGEELAASAPRDMVDLQSFIWVAHGVEKNSPIERSKQDEFASLVEEFAEGHMISDEGREHLARYDLMRREGVANFQSAAAAAAAGEDATDLVLWGLLPYADFVREKNPEAWTSVAPSFSTDVRHKYQAAGIVADPSAWPAIAQAILGFFTGVNERPEGIQDLCDEFYERDESKGFQSGSMSPALNALLPDRFLIMNNKNRAVVNYFAGTNLQQKLPDYPEANRLGQGIVQELANVLGERLPEGSRPGDVFDLLCHWLVAIKRFPFRAPRYWKVAPGEGAKDWDEWRDGGFIAIGWNDIGDISGMSKAEFDSRLEELLDSHPDWTKAGANQVWRFARHMQEGDRVVANQGTSEVVGLGTVAGPYYFVQKGNHWHRRDAEWDDVEPRAVEEPGWKRTLVELDYEKHQAIISAPRADKRPSAGPVSGPAVVVSVECPFTRRTFELLEELHAEPTRDFYNSHRDEFVEHVEEPVRELMTTVAGRLPEQMLSRLETEKRILSRIPKNDYGRGGAYDFHWAAFYPKGGRRIADPQLFISISREGLEAGFYVGDYAASPLELLTRNVREYRALIEREIAPTLARIEGLCFGTGDQEGDESRSVAGGDTKPLLAPGAAQRVAISMPVDKVLGQSKSEVVDRILGVFRAAYPLMLLSMEDDPTDSLAAYAGHMEIRDTEPPYSIAECAQETGFEEQELARWIRAIEHKKQAVIYGPPGTGKTYIAERLARHLVGGGDGFLETVQFHPAYAYEDFIQGIRPGTNRDGQLEYPMKSGRFVEFCVKARACEGRCVLIIDEINRANLSRVFGELMFLLEYRDREVPLAGGNRLSIPSNVRIIGTMNTADRSIALVDHALRRRFAFLALYPNYDLLLRFHQGSEFDPRGLIAVLRDLNRQIDNRHYELGITFFLLSDVRARIEDVWRMEVEPYLEEYFFDQPEKVTAFRWANISERVLTHAATGS